MKKSRNANGRIGPDWVAIVCALLAIPVIIYALPFWPDGVDVRYQSRLPAIIIASSCILFSAAGSTRFDEKGIVRLRFGIPYRFISWEQIDQIGKASSGKSQLLLITLVGARRFQPEKDNAELYVLKHLTKVIAIRDSKKATTIIEKHYGALDYGFSPR